MRIYSSKSVLDAALKRIRWLYDEFPEVVCGVSGGKDSTVVFNLCAQVAEEKGRLPLKCVFIDQEGEWAATIETIREIMYDPRVEPMWFQMPFRLFNATSTIEHWLHCWDPAARDLWIHPQDPISIKENVYGVDRFVELFTAIMRHHFPSKACYVSGVRTEESPGRYMGLTHDPTYKWATWGKILNKQREQYTFYPIYDWSYQDVWKAIHDNNWPYCRIYDLQYQYGCPVRDMRVSNLHHETAVRSLFYLQEFEPDTYNRLVARLPGIDMAGKLGDDDYFVDDLPFMFSDWREYRDHLLEHLINDEAWQKRFRREFQRQEYLLGDETGDKIFRAHIASILTNDHEGVKLKNFITNPSVNRIVKERRAKGLIRQTKQELRPEFGKA